MARMQYGYVRAKPKYEAVIRCYGGLVCFSSVDTEEAGEVLINPQFEN